MNTTSMEIEKLKGLVLTSESVIPLKKHKRDGKSEIFRIVPELESKLLFCGGRNKALVAFPTARLRAALEVREKPGDGEVPCIVPGQQVKVIMVSDKSVILDLAGVD